MISQPCEQPIEHDEHREAPSGSPAARSRRRWIPPGAPDVETRMKSSRLAASALWVGGFAALVGFLGILLSGLDLLSERKVVLSSIFALLTAMLGAMLAVGGWMHGRRRRDAGVDRLAIKRSFIGAFLAVATIACTTLWLDRLGVDQKIEVETPVGSTTSAD